MKDDDDELNDLRKIAYDQDSKHGCFVVGERLLVGRDGGTIWLVNDPFEIVKSEFITDAAKTLCVDEEVIYVSGHASPRWHKILTSCGVGWVMNVALQIPFEG